ncbi:uncharacterized protein LOC134690204 [Mytilus trossulus]|uniref:uncharacterized protein LOC134690204 n=1 Tax=Mytilus trossulus TaxID=6551 RepID=UPI0030054EA8
MTKKKAIRVGHRGAARRLISKIEEELEKETTQRDEIESLCETLKKKRDILSELDSEILEEIAEENMEAEIEDSDRYVLDIERILTKVRNSSSSKQKNKSNETSSNQNLNPNAAYFVFINSTSTYEKQLLRCGGPRIDNATVGETVKFPYLLPAKDRLTHFIVLKAHENTLHSGINITLAYIQQTFWIPKLRQCVKSIVMKCVTCRKVIGKSYSAPEIPPLPKERVQDATPFSITGVVFTGALSIRNSHNEESKAYICLFTCAVTRAVHLELVYDLSEESFLLCFRRFVSRRSVPKIMMSDNALTFKAASNEI